MPAKDALRYGLLYTLIYVGGLCLIFVGATIVAAFYEFRSADLSISALIAAACLTYHEFLKDKGRLPTSREYWSLVAISSIIVIVVDFALAALLIHFTRDYSVDGTIALIMIGVPLFKGVLGNMVFYRKNGVGRRILQHIEAKRARLGPPAAAPSNKMTGADIGLFLVCYFAIYIPLWMVTRYVSISEEIRGERFLLTVMTIAAAVCALAYVVRRLGRRPTRSEYALLVLASVISLTVFEFIGEMAIFYYRFAGLPNAGVVLSYTMRSVIFSAVIHAAAYSPPVAWLVRPRMRWA